MPHISRLQRLANAGLALCLSLALAACSSSSNDPTASFAINGVSGTVNGQQVTIDLTKKESCSNLNALVADIQASGATISPDPLVSRSYAAPVDFTLTTPDGSKTVYTVTVKGNACVPTPDPAPAPTPAPVPTPPTPTPTACTPEAIGSTGYSLVFKGCSATNVAEYYEKTECVRDNASGLIWQGQTAAGTGLRANDQYKTNYDSTTELQKYSGSGSVFIAPTQADIDAITNSIGFKNAVNASNLCGSSDWHIPNKDELLGLVKTSEYPKIDNLWFPNTTTTLYKTYWTSTPYPAYAYLGWVVNYGSGNATGGGYRDDDGDSYFGFSYFLVRLVRSGQSSM